MMKLLTTINQNDMAEFIEGNGHPMISKRVLPNDPCPCGSGKKAKKCHGAGSEYYYSKLTDRQKKEIELEKLKKQNQHTTEE